MVMYIASPYSHPDPKIVQGRVDEVRRFLAHAFKVNLPVFSPIAHWHETAMKYELPSEARYWEEQNDDMLYHCMSFGVLTLEGWRESVGVQRELRIAREIFRPEEVTRWERQGDSWYYRTLVE